MELSKEQLLRYSRQITLPECGIDGQKKLLSSKVMVFGAGGLGSPVLMYLSSSGVGCIGIMDDDTVDLSNLHRQIIHSLSSVGQLKTESAKAYINKINPDVEVILYNQLCSADELPDLIKNYDIVLDCTDSFESKFIVSDACVRAQKPMVHAAVSHFNGQLMTYVPGKGPCYRCVFGEPPAPGSVKTPKELGVSAPVVGIIGALEAAECIKYLTGAGELLTGQLLTVDALSMTIKKMKLPAYNEDCPVCSNKAQLLSKNSQSQQV